MAKIYPLLIFTSILIGVLTGAYFIHVAFLQNLELPFTPQSLLAPYIVNFGLALIITIVLYLLRSKQSQNLGFIFMGSSFLKFAVFFLIFNPLYKADGDVAKYEFAQFFVPYALSLTIETVFLIRILNKMDQ